MPTCLAYAAAFSLCLISQATAGEWLTVGLTRLPMDGGERIVGIHIEITAGIIHAMNGLPRGWRITIDNKADGSASVLGGAEVGAAALDADQLIKFLRIEKDESLGEKFEISGQLDVTRDFVDVRTLPLRLDNFAVAP